MNISTKFLWIALALFTVNFAMAQKPTINFDSVVHPSCQGGDGEIMISVSGGIAPYTFAWSNGSNNDTLLGINAGDFMITVTDDNGQMVMDQITLVPSGNIVVGATIVDASHCNSNDGEIFTNVTGGSGNYDYFWDNGGNTSLITGLRADNYCVTVVDGLCDVVKCFTVDEGLAFNVNSNTINETAVGAGNGAIDIAVSNGTGNYTYLWDNGSTNQDLVAITAGNYCVTVDDASVNCPQTFCFSITDLNAAVVTFDASCYGGDDARIELTTSGGTPPYNFNWSNGKNTEDINLLVAGTYTCSISDAGGNSITKSVSVGEAQSIVINVSKKNEKVDSASDGSLNISVSGGNSPYTYLWSTGETTEDIDQLSFGSYCLTVTDANGCEKIMCEYISTINKPIFNWNDKNIVGTPKEIKESDYIGILANESIIDKYDLQIAPKVDGDSKKNSFKPMVFPNPASSALNVNLDVLGDDSEVRMEIYTMGGSLVYSNEYSSIDEQRVSVDVSSIPAGIYFLQLTSKKGWYNERLVIAH